ncbi:hypothetical protein A4S06_04040 [Erysipelotrichaceae bacterium MTC7]|nr:hypothetical protein A4S06_04040 [Erysipelotrichaceae bacterium MTC7]
MASKERAIITSRYTGKPEKEELVYDLIRSIRLKEGQISVIVQSDLSVSIVANKNLSIDEINEIICVQYRAIQDEIKRIRRKGLKEE